MYIKYVRCKMQKKFGNIENGYNKKILKQELYEIIRWGMFIEFM